VKKSVWLGILFIVLVVGAVVYSTISSGGYRCEVCMTFQGRRACATASAGTREQAERTARETACGQIASGVTDSNQCNTGTADSVTWR